MGCILALTFLSWVPAQYAPRVQALSGSQDHLFGYLVAGLVMSLPLRRTKPLLATLGLIALAGVLEAGQAFCVGRDPDLSDFCASALGAMIGVALVLTIERCAPRIVALLRRPRHLGHPGSGDFLSLG
jgi:VanZ family protein